MSRIRSGGVLPRLLGYCLFLCLAGHVGAYSGISEAEAEAGVYSDAVVIDTASPIAVTDEDFICATLDWWPPEKCDYGTCSWGLASMLNLNLSSPILLNAVKAFSPLKLRLGGSLQDKVIYETLDPKQQPCTPFAFNASEMFSFTQGCLPLARWDELNEFFQKAGAIIIFGLNALNGRVNQSDGSFGGPWDNTNAASLIRYTVDKGYTIYGWELGNELSGSGVGTRVDADQYAADVVNLKWIVDDIYQGFPVKPLVLAPGGFFDAIWFAELVDKTKPNSLDVLTHHIYNLGAGVDKHLVEKILDPTYLDGEASTFKDLQLLLRTSGRNVTGCVGEAGGAYNSGHHLVTDAFVFSFWFLDQLGMSATYDTKTYCRQSLVGGNYGLLNTTTFRPNPDYYSALLWHRLMGTRVLATKLIGEKPSLIRAYAHCAKESEGITLLLINLSGNTTAELSIISITTAYSLGRKHHPGAASLSVEDAREEYHLTAMDGDLHSQTMLLNGDALEVDADGNIPALDPIKVDGSQPIVLAPFSIVFARIPSFQPPACR
ncbi:heparanase-like protein 3 [Curcuma longa]|uniref:heparanase-like protein 3 n=1 Tax=Curcuma longa TaxID=136217 RepID=UPI003D9EACD2